MADVTVRIEFDNGGFQQVLNSRGVRGMLVSYAGGVVSRMYGMAHYRTFTATGFGYGPRPAVLVWTHAANRFAAAVARKNLGGAL